MNPGQKATDELRAKLSIAQKKVKAEKRAEFHATASLEERVVEMFRRGYNHAAIADRLRLSLGDVRQIISRSTREDEELYARHKEGRR